MLLSEENLCKVLNTLAIKSGWASVMAEIGGHESTAFSWLAKSRAAAKLDDKSSPYYVQWRERWDFWHVHCGAARREHIISTEAVIRAQIRDGLEVKLYDGGGHPIWLVDAAIVGKFSDAEEAKIMGHDDWPFLLDDCGARIQATKRELVPATTRNLLLQTIPDYQSHSTLEVKSTAAVHVSHSYRRPAPTAEQAALPAPAKVESEMVRDLRAKLKAGVKNPKPDGPVQIFGRATGDRPDNVSAFPADEPSDIRDHARAYTVPALKPPQQPTPNYGRPQATLDHAGRGKSIPPVGGFPVRTSYR